MRSNLLLAASICAFILACQLQKQENIKVCESAQEEHHFDLPDSLSTRRITFALNLKKNVAQRAWEGFGTKITEGTLIYFNADKSEVFFPDSLVIKALASFAKHSDDYILAPRTDSIPFHMENMLSFDNADSTKLFYNNPVEQYCSVEEISQYIPSVQSTEMWSTMVMHEMFHHYQLNNEYYKEYAKNEISTLSFNPNNLSTLCQEDTSFLPLIHKENDLLMLAISESNGGRRDSLISSYLKKRKSRIKKYSMAHPDLEKVEDFYILQEGSARYIEYKSMFILSEYSKCIDSIVILKDPMFKSFSEFKEIDLTAKAFNYLTYPSSTDYHYTIGFNIMRILDELEIEYKPYLINKPQKGLHKYLEEYVNTLPNYKNKQ